MIPHENSFYKNKNVIFYKLSFLKTVLIVFDKIHMFQFKKSGYELDSNTHKYPIAQVFQNKSDTGTAQIISDPNKYLNRCDI